MNEACLHTKSITLSRPTMNPASARTESRVAALAIIYLIANVSALPLKTSGPSRGHPPRRAFSRIFHGLRLCSGEAITDFLARRAASSVACALPWNCGSPSPRDHFIARMLADGLAQLCASRIIGQSPNPPFDCCHSRSICRAPRLLPMAPRPECPLITRSSRRPVAGHGHLRKLRRPAGIAAQCSMPYSRRDKLLSFVSAIWHKPTSRHLLRSAFLAMRPWPRWSARPSRATHQTAAVCAHRQHSNAIPAGELGAVRRRHISDATSKERNWSRAADCIRASRNPQRSFLNVTGSSLV